jgi:hypothetical protein
MQEGYITLRGEAVMSSLLGIKWPSGVEELFKNCGRDRMFLDKYVINAVLSYIEEKEQDLALGMQYGEWVRIDKNERDKIINQMLNYLDRFSIACRGRELNESVTEELRKILSDSHIIEQSICYLYLRGIYDDCISRYLLINVDGISELPDLEIKDKDDRNKACMEASELIPKCVKLLSSREFKVRSRFIEITRDLYNLKQRFPDTSVFESPLLTSRVFAYAHPRELPLGFCSIDNVCSDNGDCSLKRQLHAFFTKYYSYFAGDNNIGNVDSLWSEYWDIVCSFLKRVFSGLRFYRFQIRGIRRAFEKLIQRIDSSEPDYLVIEAPTGSGKTEIMVLTILLTALARKIILTKLNAQSGKNSPVGLIIYPRRALANDQVTRLIRYIYYLNYELKRRGIEEKIRLTIDYTDVRPKRDYENELKKNRGKIDEVCKGKREELKLMIKYEVPAYVKKHSDECYVELRSIQCPDGSYPMFKIVKSGGELTIDDDAILCGIANRKESIDFVALTKGKVSEEPGDVHLALLETLRLNYLLSTSNEWLFGVTRRIENRQVWDSPLIIVLDEVHTYVDVAGVRYAYVLRRILNRIWYNQSRKGTGKLGTLVIGMSATIPKIADFLGRLFSGKIREDNVNDYVITVDKDETIPLGNEYFFIVVPTTISAVNNIAVSIQTIMDIFYNMPSIYNTDGTWRKKAIVFVDELNTLRRMRHDLADAIKREGSREGSGGEFGLQDLRNPRSDKFTNEYGDYENDIVNIKSGKISHVVSTKAWEDGELWWGYMLDTIVNSPRNATTTLFNNVATFSSREHDDIRNATLVTSTSSLEVGVDYSDVVLIYQHGAPLNIASLIQRAGRGGRRMYENPLMRAVVGIQLSHELPHQAWLFELFTRVKSLRDALNYDMLYLPIDSEELIKQTIAELAIEYYILKHHDTYKHHNLSSNGGFKYECSIIELLKSPSDDFMDYVYGVFKELESITKEEIRRHTEDIGNELYSHCEEGGKP